MEEKVLAQHGQALALALGVGSPVGLPGLVLAPLSLPPYFNPIISCDTKPGVMLPLKGHIWWGAQTPLNRSVGKHLSRGGHRQTLPTPERR